MLTALLGHEGRPIAPHDVLTHWNVDPTVWLGLLVPAYLYHRGSLRRPVTDRRRDLCFWAALGAMMIALVSPLDGMAAVLASAHMAQHVLIILVAAPLLALSAPGTTMLRGAPPRLRRWVTRARRVIRRRPVAVLVSAPAAVWLAHAAVLWFWHASGPYEAALQHSFVHALEHATFLVTAVLFWSIVLRGSRRAAAALRGRGALLVFTMASQSVLLSALLTFARTPWYPSYRDTTRAWGLEPLADQQLAGAIMWVPAGFVYVGTGIALVVVWVRQIERGTVDGPRASDWASGAEAAAPAHVTRPITRRP